MNIFDYKMCLFDVDKTLTNSHREITRRTRKALRVLVERGMLIGVCSGRHFATLKNFVMPYFPENSLHVVSEGSQIVKTDGTILWETLLSEDSVKLIVTKAVQSNMTVVLQKMDTLYTNSSFIPKEEKSVVRKKLEDATDFEIPVLVVYGVDDAFVQFLSSLSGISFRTMKGYDSQPYVDIMPEGVNKGEAVRKLAMLARIRTQDIVGFGDSINDIEFLDTVGYAVAMGNASADVQDSANVVIGSNDEDGLALFLEESMTEK